MPDSPHRLAGIREEIPLEQSSPYHAVAREAALEAFGRAYERGAAGDPADPIDADDPDYVMATAGGGELLVVAGAWPVGDRSCGRLVAPRDLLALLLDDPDLTAVWCDEDDGEGLALTGYAVTVDEAPMLLVVARSARAVGETAGVTDVEYDGERLTGGTWAPDALDDFLRRHDGDAIVLSPWVIDELAEHVADSFVDPDDA